MYPRVHQLGRDGRLTNTVRLKGLFQRTLLLLSSGMMFLPGNPAAHTLSLMHPEQHGQTQALGAAQGIRAISLKKNISASKLCDRNPWEVQEQAGLAVAQRHRGSTAAQTVPGVGIRLPREHSRANHGTEAALEMQPRDEMVTPGRSSSTGIFSVRWRPRKSLTVSQHHPRAAPKPAPCWASPCSLPFPRCSR